MGNGSVPHTLCRLSPVEELEYTCLLKSTFTQASHDKGLQTWQTPATYPECLFCGRKYRWGVAFVECHMDPNISKATTGMKRVVVRSLSQPLVWGNRSYVEAHTCRFVSQRLVCWIPHLSLCAIAMVWKEAPCHFTSKPIKGLDDAMRKKMHNVFMSRWSAFHAPIHSAAFAMDKQFCQNWGRWMRESRRTCAPWWRIFLRLLGARISARWRLIHHVSGWCGLEAGVCQYRHDIKLHITLWNSTDNMVCTASFWRGEGWCSWCFHPRNDGASSSNLTWIETY
jgi:hypothetical protein